MKNTVALVLSMALGLLMARPSRPNTQDLGHSFFPYGPPVICLIVKHLLCKELEQKLSRQDEATGVAMVMQTQLTKYRKLEKENAKLKDENHYYR